MADMHFLSASDFSKDAPELFQLLYENMMPISPFSKPYEEEYRLWLAAVSDGMKAPARKIITVRHSVTGDLLGFLQYYTNATSLVIEELQTDSRFHGHLSFLDKLGCFLVSQLPEELRYVEAFVHKENSRSLALQKKLGMTVVGTACDDTLYHLRGDITGLFHYFPLKGDPQ